MRSVFALVLAALLPALESAQQDSALIERLRDAATRTSGTAGVSVRHLESGAGGSINGNLRFPMMSVYKLPIVIHALRETDAGRLDLGEAVTLGPEDRRPGHSPMAQTIARDGALRSSVKEIIAAIVITSDNTASDWLLRRIGGPAAVHQTLRALGASGIDVSRYELEFSADYYGLPRSHTGKPFSLERFAAAVEKVPPAVRTKAARAYETDTRDTATPDGMTSLLIRLQRGELASPRSTSWILELMHQMHSRDTRIRAGLPPGTPVALRPGTSGTTNGRRAAHNDCGIITLPQGRGHLIVSVFLRGTTGTEAERDAAIARFATIAYEWAMNRR